MTYIPRSSSSIPGAPGTIPTIIRKKRTFRVFHVLASFIFILAILGSVGVYMLGRYSENQLNEARIALEKVSSTDDTKRVEDVGVFNQRLESAHVLLSQHLSPLHIFETLEAITKKSARLSTVIYDYQPGFEATLAFSVNAKELSSIALQNLSIAAGTLYSDFSMKTIGMGADDKDKNETLSKEDVSGVHAQFAGVLDTARFAYTPSSLTEQTTVNTNASADTASSTATTTEEINE